MFQRRSHAAAATPSPIAAPRLTRYVTAGVPAEAPVGATVADGLRFADAASDRMTMFLYPAPTAEAIRELADAWALHPLLVET